MFRMPWKWIALAGLALAAAGVAVFLIGAFVLTTDARHHDISQAVYIGFGMFVGGAAFLLFSGAGLLFARKPKQD